ncbi:hypothetical protein [Ketobacter nezhaii]|uniref:hypothetical protein n=1 Tax=Ketobacter sp. MCCC 1A13808 TaxID=2602738 RepID=UPI0012EC01C8|nr:hypothetical protein [Ketobacter sp. MCCC 1A13808]
MSKESPDTKERQKERYLKKAIEEGLKVLKTGKVIDGREAFSEIRRNYKLQ